MTTTRKKDWRKPTVKLNSRTKYKTNLKGENKMKKIGTIILAIMMIAMVGLAHADTGDNLIPNAGKINVTSGGTVTFEKTIILFNDQSLQVFEPNIVYTYTIEAVTAATTTTVTDSSNNTVHVYDGTPVAVTGTDSVVTSNTASATFATNNGLKDAAAAGSQDTKQVSFDFDATKFPHAGIYRFKITETAAAASLTTTSDALVAAGIERPSAYIASKNLDVYVKNGTSGLEIYGFVMFDDSEPASESITTADEISGNEAKKSSGFTPGGPSSSTDPTDFTSDTYCDHYKTINLTVEKQVAGSLGDTTNEFPFTYTLTLPAAIKTAVKYDYTQSGASGRTSVDIAANASGSETSTVGVVDGNTSALNLKHADTFQIIGVPFGTSFSINERNNTHDKYSTTATGTNMTVTGGEAQDFTASSVLGTAIGGTETNTTTWASGENKITITNTLAEVSPTGYVTRFAPYALILVGGILLLIIAMKRKGHKEEE